MAVGESGSVSVWRANFCCITGWMCLSGVVGVGTLLQRDLRPSLETLPQLGWPRPLGASPPPPPGRQNISLCEPPSLSHSLPCIQGRLQITDDSDSHGTAHARVGADACDGVCGIGTLGALRLCGHLGRSPALDAARTEGRAKSLSEVRLSAKRRRAESDERETDRGLAMLREMTCARMRVRPPAAWRDRLHDFGQVCVVVLAPTTGSDHHSLLLAILGPVSRVCCLAKHGSGATVCGHGRRPP